MVKFGDERRQSSRAKRILSIQYRLAKGQSSKDRDVRWHLSTTHDMSAMGLSFLSDVPYQIDDVLELQVVMSGILDIFKGHARVMRIEKKETGVYFLIGLEFVEDRPVRQRTAKSEEVSTDRLKEIKNS